MSENQIIEAYGVSNTTARRALQEVERAGWVHRIKGKGTVVQESRVGRSLDRILGFTKNMLEAGRKPTTVLLDAHKRHTDRTLTISGKTYHLQGPILVIERLRLADNIPIMYETRYISSQLCPGMLEKNLEGSLYDLYENEWGKMISEIRQSLSTILIEQNRLQAHFGLNAPVPAFLVEGVTFCGRDTILEMEESIYRGDQYNFNVTAKRR